MIPPTPSESVPPHITAQSLLHLGKPFLEFPRYSILDFQNDATAENGTTLVFSDWLTRRLQVGQPVIVQDLEKLPAWDQEAFDIERLIELSTKKNIPIRNCSTGRDLSFTLRKFADAARQSYAEFQNLYARDLPCPQEWQERCREILPTQVQWGGRLDLFQWLPQCARSEMMMAYVGSEGSSSGFHRCLSSTVALNLLVQGRDGPVICIGTDFDSQKKYDAFMSARGASPHVDWTNLGPEELRTADFPLYVCEQKVGDLVIFPPATAHQVWNPASLSTKLVWNILHPLSLEVGFQYVQPPINRLCHPDVARTSLSLAYAMLPLAHDEPPTLIPPELPLLTRLFKQLVDDETIDSTPATPIAHVQLPENVIATCNFCSTGIWNRHVRCSECKDFDLCLPCYLNGRSCEHAANYTWAEIHPPDVCTRIVKHAHEILGYEPEEQPLQERRKSLGSAVNDLMKAKTTTVTRLCHLCRIDHPQWKGRRCDKCTAFFCFRGLYRHFDMNSSDEIRHTGLWTCPKCMEVCNCRCCHFQTAYVKAEKPASKRRVKAADPRGKIMGFTDNVFDQRRGQRGTHPIDSPSQIAGQKRPLTGAEPGPPTVYRKLEAQTPEREPSGFNSVRELSDEPPIGFSPASRTASYSTGSRRLPSIRTVHEQKNPPVTLEQTTPPASAEGISALASAAASRGKMPTFLTPNTPTNPGIASPDNSEKPLGRARTQTPVSGHPDMLTPLSGIPPPDIPDMANMDNAIAQLEDRIARLRRYGEELLGLELHDSYRMLSEQLTSLEVDLRDRKREKSALLIENLQREFPGIADVARKEVEKLGYR